MLISQMTYKNPWQVLPEPGFVVQGGIGNGGDDYLEVASFRVLRVDTARAVSSLWSALHTPSELYPKEAVERWDARP